MELLFAYEDKVACDEKGNFYTGSTFSQSVFDRYLQFFSHITLLARKAPAGSDCSRMNRIDQKKISVVFLPDIRSSISAMINLNLRAEFKKTVEAQITPERAVIGRVPSTAGTIAAEYCRKIGKPFLLEVVGCPWDSYRNHSVAGKLLAPIERKMQREAVKNAPYVIYVTNEFLQKRYPTKGKAAAISDVELQPFDENILEKRLKKIQDHQGIWKIGTAAAVNIAYKGQQYVIEALAILKTQGHNEFEYHMAGGGDQSRLYKIAENFGVLDKVVFEGSLPHEKMFEWLDEMDLYIQPSLQEGLPRSVVEAMSRGLPSFGARTGGIPELLGESVIIPQKKPEAIAQMLTSLAKQQLLDRAKANFEKAKTFEKQILKEKRNAFYASFVQAYKER